MKILETDAVLDVPREVATCPYCNDSLTVRFEGWEQLDDGTWVANCQSLDCNSEPDIEADLLLYDDWLSIHTNMPYVYWLPVDNIVERWVNKHYRFNMDDQTLSRSQP